MTWIYNGTEITDEQVEPYYGFVYRITNTESDRYYIGKKQLWFTRKVKGKKRRVSKPSDWKTYFGSCKELLDDVSKLGKDKFKREVIRLCTTRGEMNYNEIRLQFELNVLEDSLSYNSNINGRWFKK